ncbi:alanine racemase [Microbacterium album]|uniref:Alanine racemase n=1 Tax=Microbacterium album TaxID=2053191 RepID=A0A917ID25_9MICO|nr:alanine racemase [Microbacterium album]GGH35337.1 alanine racemase [Microbacterium album]
MNAELRVDLARLRANITAVQDRLRPAELMMVVKDDAYGHGLEPVVDSALAVGVTWFGAFDVPTAVRTAAVTGSRARVFAWLTVGEDEIAAALAAGIELGVGDADYLERIARVAPAPAAVHLKIDTGLHRNGVRPEAWPAFVQRAAALEAAGRVRVAGIWSHIAEASDAEDDVSRALFDTAVAAAHSAGLAPEVLHLAASAAGWARPEFRYDVVRVGAFCYGVRSAGGPDLDGIAPAAALVARVEAVGADSVRIGVGALDGVPSTLGGRIDVGTPAGARELRAVGPVECVVASWPGAAVGDEVTIFGPGTAGEGSATDLGEAIDTVGEEPLLRLSPLIPRAYENR